jgi:hypothetical protein
MDSGSVNGILSPNELISAKTGGLSARQEASASECELARWRSCQNEEEFPGLIVLALTSN